MSLIKWEPFADIDTFFEVLPSSLGMGRDLAVDVYEKDDNIIAEMNLPGINPDNVDISIENNYLRVSGSREEEKEEKKKNYYSKEIKRGSFERLIRLPAKVEEEKISAEFKDGELLITLPKAKEIPSKRVKIEIKK